MLKLYELTDGYQNLQNLDLTDDDLLGALESLQDAIDDKAMGIAKIIRSLEAEAQAYKEEVQRMTDAAKARTTRAHNLKDWLQINLEAAGITRAGRQVYVTVQKAPPSARVVDEEAVSEADGYKVEIKSWKFDNRKAIETWKATKEAPPGFEVTQGQYLVIRP